MTTKYTGKDIQVLTDQEHVVKRLSVYFGSNQPTLYLVPSFLNDTFAVNSISIVPATYKAVGEILDNSIDEFKKVPSQKNKILSITATPEKGVYCISDNGRGVPIDMHATGKYTPEVVFGSLRSGRNFDDDAKELAVIGTNGMGGSVTCFTSSSFEVTIKREHKQYVQKFSERGTKVSKPKITTITSDKTGTSIDFTLDPTVFTDTKLPDNLMHNRAIEIALCNPGVTVEYNNKSYKFKKGFENIIEKISSDKNYYEFVMDTPNLYMQWFFIPNLHTELDERIFTWVNGSYLFDGGLCNTQFLNAFYDKAVEYFQSAAKKMKIEVTKNDVRQGLTIIGNVRVKNPQYDSQAKTRLTGPNIRNEISGLLTESWSSFARSNKDWTQQVLERAAARYNKDAHKLAEKQLSKQSKQKIDNLMDATGKDRSLCRLFITEGLSASGQIKEVRTPQLDAAFTLTGKINNVFDASVAQIMKMDKIVDLLAAIGLVPGKTADRSQLRYGQIIIASDSDVDGSHICALLVNLFYKWPELFDPKQAPFIYRLGAPNVVASKNNKRIHFRTLAEFEKVKDKYVGYTIEYMKGLGSMVKEDWEMLLNDLPSNITGIVSDKDFKDTIELIFGNDVSKRKEWLTQ